MQWLHDMMCLRQDSVNKHPIPSFWLGSCSWLQILQGPGHDHDQRTFEFLQANESPWRSYFAPSWPMIARSYLQSSSLKDRTFRIEILEKRGCDSTSTPQDRDWLVRPEAVTLSSPARQVVAGQTLFLQFQPVVVAEGRRMVMFFTALTGTDPKLP